MLSSRKIPSNTHKRRRKISNTNLDDNSNREQDLKMTSNDLEMTSEEPIINEKSKLKGGSVHEIDKINVEYLDEILSNDNL